MSHVVILLVPLLIAGQMCVMGALHRAVDQRNGQVVLRHCPDRTVLSACGGELHVRTALIRVGWDSSVGTATGYGLESPGIESR